MRPSRHAVLGQDSWIPSPHRPLASYPDSCVADAHVPCLAAALHVKHIRNSGKYPVLVVNADWQPLSYLPLSVMRWQVSHTHDHTLQANPPRLP